MISARQRTVTPVSEPSAPRRRSLWPLGVATALLLSGCGDDGRADADSNTQSSATSPTTSGASVPTTSGSTAGPGSTTGELSTSTAAPVTTGETTAPGCGACDEPNQQCIDDVCVTGCQGQDPDPCGPDMVCDVLSGECKDTEGACVLAGPNSACGEQDCGPGSACDGEGGCIAVAPCSAVSCTRAGACWGAQCGACERGPGCSDPAIELLNGPFAADLSALDFADDCTAWAVTVSGGQEFVRRLSSAGELTTFAAIGDFDLGEVRVLRHLTVPQLTAPPPVAGTPVPPAPVEGFGEVAVTYICCPTCGDCADNPNARGVAHLVEDDPNMPLPIVIFAEATQGVGPFGEMHLDGGPQGLTWGDDRVLYVGNALGDGDYSSADLVAASVEDLYTFTARVTASAPVSAVHNLVAVLGGDLYLFNTQTHDATLVVDLMADVTGLSQDPFDGHVYASLATLEVVRVHPFTGVVTTFATMPAKGRVAVSPSGKLWFAPVQYLNPAALVAWDLPTSL